MRVRYEATLPTVSVADGVPIIVNRQAAHAAVKAEIVAVRVNGKEIIITMEVNAEVEVTFENKLPAPALNSRGLLVGFERLEPL